MDWENNNQRDLIQKTLYEQLIGPGGDIFGFPDEIEIISEVPHKKYYSGILYSPIFSEPQPENGFEEEEEEEIADGNEDGDQILNVTNDEPDEEVIAGEDLRAAKKESPAVLYKANYPTTCGIVFLPKNPTKPLKLTFSYGKYESNNSNREIKITQSDYEKLLPIIQNCENNDAIINKYGNDSFSQKLTFENNILHLRSVPSYIDETGKLKLIRNDKVFINQFYEATRVDPLMRRKFMLLLGNSYVRTPLTKEITINNLNALIENGFYTKGEIIEHGKLKYHIKAFLLPDDRTMVKVLLQNVSEAGKKNYEDCYFQINIKATAGLDTYHEPIHSVIDEDFSMLEYQYQDEKSYGKGINCAALWDKESDMPSYIETTFMPDADIKSFSNAERSDFIEKNFSEIFDLHNISVWGFDDNILLSKLSLFAESYKDWIEDQKAKTSTEHDHRIPENLIRAQNYIYNRIVKNIKYLEENSQAMFCFRLANTAMMMQMVIARDTRFKKARHLSDIPDNDCFDRIGFFEDYPSDDHHGKTITRYRPFQLAFLLMNIEPTFNKQSVDRNEKVDLIWFPTGGGKTEAYLALTALTIIERRINNTEAKGISVLMRYTLRLLTAQQFERATWLICSLEFLKNKYNPASLKLGSLPITIGMWVGQSASPNRFSDLDAYRYRNRFFDQIEEGNLTVNNPFPISYCPWCGCRLIVDDNHQNNGYEIIRNNGRITGFNLFCPNETCAFHSELPVTFIDDEIYRHPPTLLFATVDKTVQISHRSSEDVRNLFNKELPPDLIIQDELHLLSGPLGTLTGLYESIIDLLCTKNDGIKPKIVASTATIRNSKSLIRQMYKRDLIIFPPTGIRYSDNFFSFVNPETKRKHIGIIPSGHTAVAAEIKIVATLFHVKILLLKEFLLHKNLILAGLDRGDLLALLNSPDFRELVDPYWSFVLYYNSLRDLGRSNSRVTQEFMDQIRGLFKRFGLEDEYKFLYRNLSSRSEEFTSRQDSSRIRELLDKISSSISFGLSENGFLYCKNSTIDLSLVSNMFSVGIDVDRLNLMLMIGQPNSVSEYIQASSRVARKNKGLVINLLNPIRARELSFFENFAAFHSTYYKNVEPLSVTPFTEVAVEKLLNAILLSFVKDKLGLLANQFTIEKAEALYAKIEDRIINEEQKEIVRNKLNFLGRKWIDYIIAKNDLNYDHLRGIKNSNHYPGKPEFKLMNSLRDIDPDLYIKNSNLSYNQ